MTELTPYLVKAGTEKKKEDLNSREVRAYLLKITVE